MRNFGTITAMDSITITIREAGAGRYDAYADGRYLLTSAQPLLDGARALLAQGCDPAAMLTMVRPPSTAWAMRAPIGAAAKLTVSEKEGYRPTFRPFRGAPESMTCPPLVRRNGGVGITVASSL
jgi:hypothetical protein